ncbi:hypothetical protein M569_13588 [Genlisea aurea]|uniref:protein-serine/threonine phosphatase n=1 Tax=Genlisea aurea TaxID=192259 RepID=S8C3G3_9LAMI|nr:hypothetical protein M569_13588 [Genlisea aurea]
MGNGVGKLGLCFTGVDRAVGEDRRRRKDLDPPDDLGHSFCYIRPELKRLSSSKVHSESDDPLAAATTTAFKSISGAAVSANTSTALSTSLPDFCSCNRIDRASAFESSTSFAAIPLQPIPRNPSVQSGPLINSGFAPNSGPMERGFLSGPIERGFMSGPIPDQQFERSYSHGGSRVRKISLIRTLKRALSRGIARGQNSVVAPIKGIAAAKESIEEQNEEAAICVAAAAAADDLQWAQGKAGEDRVHVVVSEVEGWVFVGIYDGFNGPDAPDYLLSNLYAAVRNELRGILWDDDSNSSGHDRRTSSSADMDDSDHKIEESCSKSSQQDADSRSAKKRERNNNHHRRWRCEWDRERSELLHRNNNNNNNKNEDTNHDDILKALSRALQRTESAYLDIADKMEVENPELALMGSCVLVMVMKEQDVYIMNVGDSRAILARSNEPDSIWSQDLERIKEETTQCDDDTEEHRPDSNLPCLTALQLTMEHSTAMEEEVKRIRKEHPDDASAVINDRVKGSLKVTRAFGAGFLKQPKWNNALLEMFRIDYVGKSPYISCVPWLHHHRLGPRDRFLILSSDGLYQYLTNEEAVSEVELFLSLFPEGDPAQHLVEELLFRAANKAGMDFHELLEIPQGDRRRYHDDVSIIVISLEGRIWRSSA